MTFRNLMISSSAAMALLASANIADAGYVQSWLDSKGGCQPGSLQLLGDYVRPGDRTFLRRPAQDCTDEDVEEYLTVYAACVRRFASFATGMVNPTPEKIEARVAEAVGRLKRNFIEPARAQASAENAKIEARRKLAEERALREQEQFARQAERDGEAAAESRRLEEDRTRRDRERLQEQAKRDRAAAEEARRRAEAEEPKIAEVAKEADAARREREAAEQRLAEIRSRIGAEEEKRRKTFAEAQDRSRIGFATAASVLGCSIFAVQRLVATGRLYGEETVTPFERRHVEALAKKVIFLPEIMARSGYKLHRNVMKWLNANKVRPVLWLKKNKVPMFDRVNVENILGRPISIGGAYPKETKRRLLAMVESGSSVHQASKICDVTYPTAKAWVRARRNANS